MMDNERGANSLDNETQLLIPIWAYEMIQKKKGFTRNMNNR